jgi:hypothetical protein
VEATFTETTHVQYQTPGTGFLRSWIGFTFRYDSGLVAGSVPRYGVTDPNSPCLNTSVTLPNRQSVIDLSRLNADEEFQGGTYVRGHQGRSVHPTANAMATPQYTSNLVKVPVPKTVNNDKNPQRIQPRKLFDASIGEDNIFKGDRYRWSSQAGCRGFYPGSTNVQ